MFLLGGVLFWLIGLMDEAWPGAPLAVQMALGVWDYSEQQHNLMGQVCLPFAACWVGLAGATVVLDDVLRWALFGEALSLPGFFR